MFSRRAPIMNEPLRSRNRRALLATAIWLRALCLVLPITTYAASNEIQPRCGDRQEQHLSESLEGISLIVIEARPSELSISGEAARTSLNATASLCDADAKLFLRARRDGSALHLYAERSDEGRRFLVGRSTSLRVNVSVPHDATIEIVELLGPASIHGVSAVAVRGGIGALAISDIRGDVYARTRMGGLSAMRIAGNVDVANGVGQVLLAQIDGNVRVAEDRAGQITIDSVRGNALIESDTSGEVRIGRVTGDVLIAYDASGPIVAADIGGTFTVGDKTSGRIDHSNVRGAVHVPAMKTRAKRGPR